MHPLRVDATSDKGGRQFRSGDGVGVYGVADPERVHHIVGYHADHRAPSAVLFFEQGADASGEGVRAHDEVRSIALNQRRKGGDAHLVEPAPRRAHGARLLLRLVEESVELGQDLSSWR